MPLSAEKRQKNQDTLGLRLKKRREKLGFTQAALARELGIEYYTMISQMELGYISIPPSLWAPLADALQFEKSKWVLECLDEGYPEIKQALFGYTPMDEIIVALDMLRRGQIEDEQTA